MSLKSTSKNTNGGLPSFLRVLARLVVKRIKAASEKKNARIK